MSTVKSNKKFDEEVKLIERYHFMRLTAACTDGSGYFVPVGPNGTVRDIPIHLTPAKMTKLANLRPPKRR